MFLWFSQQETSVEHLKQLHDSCGCLKSEVIENSKWNQLSGMFLIKEQQFLGIDRPVNNSQSIYKKKTWHRQPNFQKYQRYMERGGNSYFCGLLITSG